jgi:uncharacterized protein with NRDE domain
MCLLFLYINENAAENEYKLILIDIRDESFDRPTLPAHFWVVNKNIVGGQDAMEGSAGGTWLAMNKDNGRIGVLLNVIQENIDKSPKTRLGRGFIVNDFLSGNRNPEEFTNGMVDMGRKYNGFQIIALQIEETRVIGSYYTNYMSTDAAVDHPPIQLGGGVHSFGSFDNPLIPQPRVGIGRQKFEEVVKKHKNVSTKEELIADLLRVMTDKELDLCLDVPASRYGSRLVYHDIIVLMEETLTETRNSSLNLYPFYRNRSWTIILVDASLNVTYVESSYDEPIITDKTGVKNKRISRKYSFSLWQC